MSWSATCGARIAHDFKGGHTSAAIWSRCGRRRFPPAIRHQRGGRENGNRKGDNLGRPVTTIQTWDSQKFAPVNECIYGRTGEIHVGPFTDEHILPFGL